MKNRFKFNFLKTKFDRIMYNFWGRPKKKVTRGAHGICNYLRNKEKNKKYLIQMNNDFSKFQVGYFTVNHKWVVESVHDNENDANERKNYLNRRFK